MNSILKTVLFFSVFFCLFLSCTKDDATSLTVTNQDISLKTGQSDTLQVTINFTGEQTKVPVTVTVSDNTIASATILPPPTDKNQSSPTFSRSVVIKALSRGMVSVIIHAGSKKMTCSTTITQTSLLLNQSVVMNYGLAIETSNNNVFIMDLFPETFKLDLTAESFSGSGQFIHFESFLPPSITSLPAGTYPCDINGSVNTFLPGGFSIENGQSNPYGTYMATAENNQVTYTLIKSGQYTVSFRGSTLGIEGDLTTTTDEIIHFSYFGPVTVVDKTEKPEVVNPQFTKGELYYAGDFYNMGVSSTFFAYFETANVDLSSNTLDGEVLIVQFDTEEYCRNYIPAGTYKVLTPSEFADYAVRSFSIVPGNFSFYQGQPVIDGSWYYNQTSRKRLISGTVVINNSGTKYSFYDRIGSQVTGSFSGTLDFKSNVKSLPGIVKSTTNNESSANGFSSFARQQSKTFGSIHEKDLRFTGAE
jgi:hypothetical protein